jgi:hypothetical protein
MLLPPAEHASVMLLPPADHASVMLLPPAKHASHFRLNSSLFQTGQVPNILVAQERM